MTTSSISETKARLSAILDLVKAGESVTITNRGIPVAQIVPLSHTDLDWEDRLRRLERDGLITRGRGGRADVLLTPPPDVGGSVLELLLKDRREGR